MLTYILAERISTDAFPTDAFPSDLLKFRNYNVVDEYKYKEYLDAMNVHFCKCYTGDGL